MSDLPTAPEHFKLTTTGLIIEGRPGLDDCLDYGRQLFYFAGMAPLIIADLYIYTAALDDAKAASMVPAIGRTKHTLQNWLSIARAFPVSRRREGLEMGHYDAIAGIKTHDGLPNFAAQDEMIKRAAAESWPISKTRDEANKLNESSKRRALRQENDGPKQIEDGEIVEVEDDDDGKSVFDSTGAGQSMSAEDRRGQIDAYREQDLRDTNQNLLSVLGKIESFGNAANYIRDLNVATMNRERLVAASVFFADLALKVSEAQRGALGKANSYTPGPDTLPRDGGHGANQSSDEVGAGFGVVGALPSQFERPADLTYDEPLAPLAKSDGLPQTDDDPLKHAASVSPTS